MILDFNLVMRLEACVGGSAKFFFFPVTRLVKGEKWDRLPSRASQSLSVTTMALAPSSVRRP